MTEQVATPVYTPRRDTNLVVASGRLGKDPENRFTPSGKKVTKFSLAIQDAWSDQNGERQGHTNWMFVECWGNLADTVEQYLSKGRKVLVEGRIRVTQNEGRYYTSIVASSISFLDAPKEGQAQAEEEEIPF